MQEATMSPLAAWESFYVILGSAAAVLTGLVFVVITLTTEKRARRSGRAVEAVIGAFNTPTVVHFCVVLLVSMVISAPWQALWHASLVLSLAALAGVAYSIIALRRLRRQIIYQPMREDWVWFGISPLLAYIGLLIAALLLPGIPAPALFGIGAFAAALVFISIRNAWDAVTYIAESRAQPRNEPAE